MPALMGLGDTALPHYPINTTQTGGAVTLQSVKPGLEDKHTPFGSTRFVHPVGPEYFSMV